jgi:signal peptidase II
VRAGTDSTTRRTLAAIGAIALVVLVADLAVKRAVTSALGPEADRHAWWLVEDVVGLEYVQNSGAAFGIMRGNPELLAAVSLLVGAGFVWLLLQELDGSPWTMLSGGLLVGGGVGNLVERFGDGYVTDYIAVGPWPRFNIADSAITVAIAIFAIALMTVDTKADRETVRHGETSEGQRDGQA